MNTNILQILSCRQITGSMNNWSLLGRVGKSNLSTQSRSLTLGYSFIMLFPYLLDVYCEGLESSIGVCGNAVWSITE
jgi:hypothetical protein